MNELSRTSALASRHIALGSGLEDWNGMGTAWSYHSDPDDEHDAIRDAAGLFDMSPLKKVFVRGPDAAWVVDDLITRDMTTVYPGKSAYGAILTEHGTVCDDAIVANNGHGEWMLCHGSGESMERLRESANGLNVDVELDDDLHNLSLQGPQSLPLLDAHTPMDLAALPYFHHQATELFGHPCRISRTGYSGERGYEIFARAEVVCELWDELLAHGADRGIMPCSFAALDKVRIEAALLFFGYDMTAEHSPWEVGLGFTVSRSKGRFRGQQAVMALENQVRFLPAGIVVDHEEALTGGEILRAKGEEVGIVNSPCWSRRMRRSLALVHLRPAATAPGTRLEVSGDGFSGTATVAEIPFYDRFKARTHAR